MKLLEGETVHKALGDTLRTFSDTQDNVQNRLLTNVMFIRLEETVRVQGLSLSVSVIPFTVPSAKQTA